MYGFNFTHIGYTTPPSVTKKKAFIQLQNAPSSRKGQSTLDTSPDKVIANECAFQFNQEKELDDDTKFSQALFNKLLNDCESTSGAITVEPTQFKKIEHADAEKAVANLMNLFNLRHETILSVFVIY
jgi:hypothetical protein